jgi:hypothetical protein
MQDDDLWLSLARGGQRLAAERFSPAVVLPLLQELLDRGVNLASAAPTAHEA